MLWEVWDHFLHLPFLLFGIIMSKDARVKAKQLLEDMASTNVKHKGLKFQVHRRWVEQLQEIVQDLEKEAEQKREFEECPTTS